MENQNNDMNNMGMNPNPQNNMDNMQTNFTPPMMDSVNPDIPSMSDIQGMNGGMQNPGMNQMNGGMPNQGMNQMGGPMPNPGMNQMNGGMQNPNMGQMGDPMQNPGMNQMGGPMPNSGMGPMNGGMPNPNMGQMGNPMQNPGMNQMGGGMPNQGMGPMNGGMPQNDPRMNPIPNQNINNNQYEQEPPVKEKKNKKIFIIIGAAVGLVVLLFILVGLFGGGHKNTTGSNKYKASDVSLNCHYNKDNAEIYIDVLYNYENYQAAMFFKTINTSSTEITDEKYKTYIDQLKSPACVLGDIDCTASHLELGITSFGFDTVIDRSSKSVTATYYTLSGKNVEATSSDKEDVKKELVNQGFECN